MSLPQPIDVEQMTRRSKRMKDQSKLEYADTPTIEKVQEIVVQNEIQAVEPKKKQKKSKKDEQQIQESVPKFTRALNMNFADKNESLPIKEKKKSTKKEITIPTDTTPKFKRDPLMTNYMLEDHVEDFKALEDTASAYEETSVQLELLQKDLDKKKEEVVIAEKDVRQSIQMKKKIEGEVAQGRKKPSDVKAANKNQVALTNIFDKAQKEMIDTHDKLNVKKIQHDEETVKFKNIAQNLSLKKEEMIELMNDTDESTELFKNLQKVGVTPSVPTIVKKCEFMNDMKILGSLKKIDEIDDEYKCLGFAHFKDGDSTVFGAVRCKAINDVCPTKIDHSICSCVIPFDIKKMFPK